MANCSNRKFRSLRLSRLLVPLALKPLGNVQSWMVQHRYWISLAPLPRRKRPTKRRKQKKSQQTVKESTGSKQPENQSFQKAKANESGTNFTKYFTYFN
jgi:hypothetical protein